MHTAGDRVAGAALWGAGREVAQGPWSQVYLLHPGVAALEIQVGSYQAAPCSCRKARSGAISYDGPSTISPVYGQEGGRAHVRCLHS